MLVAPSNLLTKVTEGIETVAERENGLVTFSKCWQRKMLGALGSRPCGARRVLHHRHRPQTIQLCVLLRWALRQQLRFRLLVTQRLTSFSLFADIRSTREIGNCVSSSYSATSFAAGPRYAKLEGDCLSWLLG
jgi:hypothetical protein